MNPNVLKTDPEFQSKIPPLTFEELNQLEANILRDGRILNPIIVWEGLIVDGHNRYTIAKKHPEIPFTIHEKEFASRYEAIIWICKNQLGRRNLTPEQKKYLIGKQYEAEKMKLGGDHGNSRSSNGTFSPNSQNGDLGNSRTTCKKIAAENGISKNTVLRAEQFSKGVDAAEEAVPGTRKKVLSGEVKLPPLRSHPLPVPLRKTVRRWSLQSAKPKSRCHKNRNLLQPQLHRCPMPVHPMKMQRPLQLHPSRLFHQKPENR